MSVRFFHLGTNKESAVGFLQIGSATAVCTLQLRAFNDVFSPVSVGSLCKQLLDFFANGRGCVTTEV